MRFTPGFIAAASVYLVATIQARPMPWDPPDVYHPHQSRTQPVDGHEVEHDPHPTSVTGYAATMNASRLSEAIGYRIPEDTPIPPEMGYPVGISVPHRHLTEHVYGNNDVNSRSYYQGSHEPSDYSHQVEDWHSADGFSAADARDRLGASRRSGVVEGRRESVAERHNRRAEIKARQREEANLRRIRERNRNSYQDGQHSEVQYEVYPYSHQTYSAGLAGSSSHEYGSPSVSHGDDFNNYLEHLEHLSIDETGGGYEDANEQEQSSSSDEGGSDARAKEKKSGHWWNRSRKGGK